MPSHDSEILEQKAEVCKKAWVRPITLNVTDLSKTCFHNNLSILVRLSEVLLL